jgi:hypothetical protein
MISLRKPHLKRRAEPNIPLIKAFLDNLNAAKKNYDSRYIINCDDTNWPVIMSPRKIWLNDAKKDAKQKSEQRSVVAKVNGEPKLSFTIMAAINMAGEGLPLYMIAKGKTELCERQLNAQDETQLDHSESGWVTVNVMERYFEFLRFTVDQKYGLEKRNRVLLVLDMYAAHRNEEILKAAANRLRIDLVFVPPGMTGELQPLDATIFGALKSAGQKAWVELFIANPKQKFDRFIASENAQACWSKVTKRQILQAWEKVGKNGNRLLTESAHAHKEDEEIIPTRSSSESSEFIPEDE